MKIICEKEKLVEGINIVNKAVPSKTSYPILECILIDSTGKDIKLIANNMELGIETIIDGDIRESGMVAIKAKTFLDIVRSMPSGSIYIETFAEDEALITKISCNGISFDINSHSGDKFTFLPYVEKDNPIVISQYTLKEMIKQTIFSISTSENNKLMTGELFEIKDNNLKIASLDGNRISQRVTGLKNKEDDLRITVPGKTLGEINKILSGEMDKEVEIYVTSNHILFSFDDTTVVSRLIEGKYFNIDQMMSNEYETKVTVNKKDILDCIERSTLLIREGEKKPIIINIYDGKINFRMKSLLGKMNETIDANKEGKDLLIGFNPNFFIEALRVIDDEEVDMYFTSPNAPCFIRDEEGSYDYLILPLKFAGDNM